MILNGSFFIVVIPIDFLFPVQKNGSSISRKKPHSLLKIDLIPRSVVAFRFFHQPCSNEEILSALPSLHSFIAKKNSVYRHPVSFSDAYSQPGSSNPEQPEKTLTRSQTRFVPIKDVRQTNTTWQSFVYQSYFIVCLIKGFSSDCLFPDALYSIHTSDQAFFHTGNTVSSIQTQQTAMTI